MRSYIVATFFSTLAISVCLISNRVCSAQDVKKSELTFRIVNESSKLLPCRIHLYDADGEPQKPKGLPSWNDHFVCDGMVKLNIKGGKYRYEIERGPEYESKSAVVEINDSNQELKIVLKRISNLRQLGWYSGELHIHRSLADVELLMKAEDLDFGGVITWWNKRNPWKELPPKTIKQFDGHRIYDLLGGEDEREGGALLYFGMRKPIEITKAKREFPSPMQFVDLARQQKRIWIDIEKPFWWDVPTWLASGQMNSIGIANNHMCRSQMLPNEAWGRARDQKRLPSPLGNGYWTQEIYYHILNSGLRIPPSAGSASGVLKNPVGYNRVYVHLEKEFNRDNWFEGLRQGRSFVTNGPLLIAKCNNKFPGEVFHLTRNKDLKVDLELSLTSRDAIEKLEIIHNGKVLKKIELHTIRAFQKMEIFETSFKIKKPGWFLIRAISNNKKTFRFASTAPWYVKGPNHQRLVSRASAQFFLDWIDERIERVKKNVKGAKQLENVLLPHQQGKAFWQKKVSQANAE